tara:strand:- start:7928 stop:8326 length:399 start_codon:yes stop_codon:yes gene_type:complete
MTEFAPVNHYHDLAMDICNLYTDKETGEKKFITQDEINGYYGVAAMFSFLKGVEPSAYEISKHLGIEPDILDRAVDRLRVNGLLGNKKSIRKDKVLKSQHHKFGTKWISEEHFSRVAWCFVAGVASGFIGLQ